MAEKTKSAVWQFQRLNARDGETYQLNKDEPTKIGRNETSDIFCNTKLASRNHCTVTIEEDYDRIVVSDFVSITAIHLFSQLILICIELSFHCSQAMAHL